MKPPLNFNEIPQLTQCSGYAVDVCWDWLEDYIARSEPALDLSPDFQRGHIWTQNQRTAFIEFCLRGGQSSRALYFNCPGWHEGSTEGPYQIVDGLQRLTAVRMFLRDEVPIFDGYVFSECTGALRFHQGFKWHINDLDTRAKVLTWYLELNSGGTPHADSEIARVRALLKREQT